MISLICDIAGEAILYGLGRFIDYAIRQNQNSIGRRQEARTSKADNCDAVDGNRCEYEVIMRALRKLTTQKIVTEDTTLFMGLVGDLFIALDVPRTRELEFENQIRQAMVDLKLQHKNNFILKVLKNIYIYIYIIRSIDGNMSY
ncbi:dynein heavy chain 17, axonemal-like isoform X1 [Acyrthosiphon pisum]|uniref:Dynein heavy chain hydrolytic ATP-binding dynein motor region domain-containing protein n=1 Tax=Acyrthosiphon pisum TaxID=7029 RepID=A0A8R2JX64_ACYPI|nr:dynein heavy chain 17, axonemal-like isoform X1 [Acyrthosiphon pisum]